MNLLCPSCQKMLQVPDQYAGQQMRCPLCNNIFTVPGLADAPAMPPAPPPFSPPAAPPPPTHPDPMQFKPSDAPAPPPVSEPTKSRAPAPPAPPPVVGDYEKLRSYFISPRVIPWITFGAVTTMFLMSFFPYGFATYTPGKVKAASTENPTVLTVSKLTGGDVVNAVKGNAWGLGFGDGDAIFLIYDLLLVFAFLVAVGSILIQLKLIPAPPPLDGLRGLALGGLLLVAFVFMFLKQLIGVFEMGVLPLTFFGLLAFWAHLLALVTVTFEIWLQRRGPTRPTPRIDVHW